MKTENQVNSERCIYCDAVLPADDEPVPPVNDAAAWRQLREIHNDGCEWVETRAHRLPDPTAD